MVLFGMPVGLGLGRDHEPHYGRREGMVLMPYDPLWVGQLAGLRGRTVEPAAGPRGTCCHRQYSFRRQPEVTQRDKGVTTQMCYISREEGASPVSKIKREPVSGKLGVVSYCIIH